MKENITESFSQHKSFKLVVNHWEKLFFPLFLIIILLRYEDFKGQLVPRTIIIFAIIIILFYLFKQLLKKVIWRFDVNFDSERVTFYLCRSKQPIIADFSEINTIRVNGPIVFTYGKKKIYYSTDQYLKVLPTLNRIVDITWGNMCYILGPNESIRRSVESTINKGADTL